MILAVESLPPHNETPNLGELREFSLEGKEEQATQDAHWLGQLLPRGP
jgi:hypothetical protein